MKSFFTKHCHIPGLPLALKLTFTSQEWLAKKEMEAKVG